MEEELRKKRQFRNGLLKLIFGILGGFVAVCGIVVGIMFLTGAFDPVVTPPESLAFEYESYESNGEDELYLTVLGTPDNLTEKAITVSVDNNTIFGLKGMTSGNEGNSIDAEIGEKILVVPKKNAAGVLIGGKTQVVAKTPDQKFTARASVFIDVPVQTITINAVGASNENKLYVGGSLNFSSLTYYPLNSQNPLNDINKIADKSYILTLSSARIQDGEEIWDSVGSYWKFDGATRSWSFSTEDTVTGSFVANWDTNAEYPRINTIKVGKFKVTAHAFKSYYEEANVGAGQIFDYMSIKAENVYEVTQVGIASIATTNYSNARLGLRYIKAAESTRQKIYVNASYALEENSFDLGLKLTAIAGFEEVDLSSKLSSCYISTSNSEAINILGASHFTKEDGTVCYYPYTDGVDYYWLVDTFKTTSNTTLKVGIVDSNTNEEFTCAVQAYSEEISTDLFDWLPTQLEMFIEEGVSEPIDLKANINDYIVNKNADSTKTPSHSYVSFYAVDSDDGLLESRIDVDVTTSLTLESGVTGYLITDGILNARGFGEVTIYAVLSKTNYNGEVETIGGSIIYKKADIKLVINTVISNAELHVVDYLETGTDFENQVQDLYENKQYAIVIKPLTSDGNPEDVEVLKQAIDSGLISFTVKAVNATGTYIHADTTFVYDEANALYYVKINIDDLSKININSNIQMVYRLELNYRNKVINSDAETDEYKLIKTSITSVELLIVDPMNVNSAFASGKSKVAEAEAMAAIVYKAYVYGTQIQYNYNSYEGSNYNPGKDIKPLMIRVNVQPNTVEENKNAYIVESSNPSVIKINNETKQPEIINVSDEYIYLTAYASTNREIFSMIKIKVEAEEVSFQITNDNKDQLTTEGYVINNGSYSSEVYYEPIYVTETLDIKSRVTVLYHNGGAATGQPVLDAKDFISYTFTPSETTVYQEFDADNPSVVRIIHNPNKDVPLTVNIITKFGQTAKYHLMIKPAVTIEQTLVHKFTDDDNTTTYDFVAMYKGKEYQAGVFRTGTAFSYNISAGITFKLFGLPLGSVDPDKIEQFLEFEEIEYVCSSNYATVTQSKGDIDPTCTLTSNGTITREISIASISIMQKRVDKTVDEEEGDSQDLTLFTFEFLILPDLRVTSQQVLKQTMDGEKYATVYNAGEYDITVYPPDAKVVDELTCEEVVITEFTTIQMFKHSTVENPKPNDCTRIVLSDFFGTYVKNPAFDSANNQVESMTIIRGGNIASLSETQRGAITISDEVFVDTIVTVRVDFNSVVTKYYTEYNFIVRAKYALTEADDRKVYAGDDPRPIVDLYTSSGNPPFTFVYYFPGNAKEYKDYARINENNAIVGLKYSNKEVIELEVHYIKDGILYNTYFRIKFTVEYNLKESDDDPHILGEYRNATKESPQEVQAGKKLDLQQIFSFKQRNGTLLTPEYMITELNPKDNNEEISTNMASIVSGEDDEGNLIHQKYILFHSNYLQNRIIVLSARPLGYEGMDMLKVYFKLLPGETISIVYPFGEADNDAVLIDGQPSEEFMHYEQLSAGDSINLLGTISMKYSSEANLNLEQNAEFKVQGVDSITGDIFNAGKTRVVAKNTYVKEEEHVWVEKEEDVSLTFTAQASLNGVEWSAADASQITVTPEGVVTISPNLGLTTWFRIVITSEGGINAYYLINAVVPKEDIQANGGIYEVIYSFKNPVVLSGDIYQSESVDSPVETKVINLLDDTEKKISVVDKDNYDYEQEFMFKFLVKDENARNGKVSKCSLVSDSVAYSDVSGVYTQTATYLIDGGSYTFSLTNTGLLTIPANAPTEILVEIYVYNHYFIYERPYVVRIGDDIKKSFDYESTTLGYSVIYANSEAVEMTYGPTGRFMITNLQGVDIKKISVRTPQILLQFKDENNTGNNKNNGSDILELSEADASGNQFVIASNNVADPDGTLVGLSIDVTYYLLDRNGDEYEVKGEFVYYFLVMPATSINFYNDVEQTLANSEHTPYEMYQTQTVDVGTRVISENLSPGQDATKPDDVKDITYSVDVQYKDVISIDDTNIRVVGDVTQETIIGIKATTWYGYYTYFYVKVKPMYRVLVKGGAADQVYDLYSYQTYNPLKELTDCEEGTRYVVVEKYDFTTSQYVALTVDQLFADGFVNIEFEYMKEGVNSQIDAVNDPNSSFMSYYYRLVEDTTITDDMVAGKSLTYHNDYNIYYYEINGKKYYHNPEYEKYYEIVNAKDTWDVTIDPVKEDEYVTVYASLTIKGSKYDGSEVVLDGNVADQFIKTTYLLHIQQNIRGIAILNEKSNGETNPILNSKVDRFVVKINEKHYFEDHIEISLLSDYNLSEFYSKTLVDDLYKVEVSSSVSDALAGKTADGNEYGMDYWIVQREGVDPNLSAATYKVYYDEAKDKYCEIWLNVTKVDQNEILRSLYITADSNKVEIGQVRDEVTGLNKVVLTVMGSQSSEDTDVNISISDKAGAIEEKTAFYVSVNHSYRMEQAVNFSQAYSGETIDLNILGDSFVANNGESLVDGTLEYYLVNDASDAEDALAGNNMSRYERIRNGILSVQNVTEKTEKMVLIVFEKNGKRYLGVTTIVINPRYAIESKYDSEFNYELVNTALKDDVLDTANYWRTIEEWAEYLTFYRNGEVIKYSSLKNSNCEISLDQTIKSTDSGATFTFTLEVIETVNVLVEGVEQEVEYTYYAQTEYNVVFSADGPLNYTYVAKQSTEIDNFYNGDKITLDDQVGAFYLNDTVLGGTFTFTILNSQNASNVTLTTANGKTYLETKCSLEEQVVAVLVEFSFVLNGETRYLYAIMDVKLNASVFFGVSYENVEQKVTIIQVGEALNLANTLSMSYNNKLANLGTFNYSYEFNVYDEKGFSFSAYQNEAHELYGARMIRHADETTTLEEVSVSQGKTFFTKYFDFNHSTKTFTPKLNLQMCSVIIKTVITYTYEGVESYSAPIYFHLSVQGVEYTFTPADETVELSYTKEARQRRYFTKYDLHLFGEFSIQQGVSEYEVVYESSDTMMFNFASELVLHNMKEDQSIVEIIKYDPNEHGSLALGDTITLTVDEEKNISYEFILTTGYYVSSIMSIEDMATQVVITFVAEGSSFYALVDVMIISPIELYANASSFQHGTEDARQDIVVKRTVEEQVVEQNYVTMLTDLMSYITMENIELIGFENISINLQLSILNDESQPVTNLYATYRKPKKVEVDVNEEVVEVDDTVYAFFDDENSDPAIRRPFFIKMFYGTSHTNRSNTIVCYFAPFGDNIDYVLQQMGKGYKVEVAFGFTVETTKQTSLISYRIDYVEGFTDTDISFSFDLDRSTELDGVTVDATGNLYTIRSGTKVTAEALRKVATLSVGGTEYPYTEHAATSSLVFISGAICEVSTDGDYFITSNVLQSAQGVVYFTFQREADSSIVSASFVFTVAPIFTMNTLSNAFVKNNVSQLTISVDEGKEINLYSGKMGAAQEGIVYDGNNVLGLTNIDSNADSALTLNMTYKLYNDDHSLVSVDDYGKYFILYCPSEDSVEESKLTTKPGSAGKTLVIYLEFSYSGSDVAPLYYSLVVNIDKCWDYVVDPALDNTVPQIASVEGENVTESVSGVKFIDYNGVFKIGDVVIDRDEVENSYSVQSRSYRIISNPESLFVLSPGGDELWGEAGSSIVRPYDLHVAIQERIVIGGIEYFGAFEIIYTTSFEVKTEAVVVFVNEVFDVTNYFDKELEGTEGKAIKELYHNGNLVEKTEDKYTLIFDEPLDHYKVYAVFYDNTAYCLDVFARYDSVKVSYILNNVDDTHPSSIVVDESLLSVPTEVNVNDYDSTTPYYLSNIVSSINVTTSRGDNASYSIYDADHIAYSISGTAVGIVEQTSFILQEVVDAEGNPTGETNKLDGQYKNWCLISKARTLETIYNRLQIEVTFENRVYTINIPIVVKTSVVLPVTSEEDPILVAIDEYDVYDLSIAGLKVQSDLDVSSISAKYNSEDETISFEKTTGYKTLEVDYVLDGTTDVACTVYYKFKVRRTTNEYVATAKITVPLNDYRAIGFAFVGNTLKAYKNTSSTSDGNFFNTSNAKALSTTFSVKYHDKTVTLNGDAGVTIISSGSEIYTKDSDEDVIRIKFIQLDRVEDFVILQVNSDIGQTYFIKVDLTINKFTDEYSDDMIIKGETTSGQRLSTYSNLSVLTSKGVDKKDTFTCISYQFNSAFCKITDIDGDGVTKSAAENTDIYVGADIDDGHYEYSFNKTNLTVYACCFWAANNIEKMNITVTFKLKLYDSPSNIITYQIYMDLRDYNTSSPSTTPNTESGAVPEISYSNQATAATSYYVRLTAEQASQVVALGTTEEQKEKIQEFVRTARADFSINITKLSNTAGDNLSKISSRNSVGEVYIGRDESTSITYIIDFYSHVKINISYSKPLEDIDVYYNGTLVDELTFRGSDLNAVTNELFDLTELSIKFNSKTVNSRYITFSMASGDQDVNLLKYDSDKTIKPFDANSYNVLRFLLYDYTCYLQISVKNGLGDATTIKLVPIRILAKKHSTKFYVDGVDSASYKSESQVRTAVLKEFGASVAASVVSITYSPTVTDEKSYSTIDAVVTLKTSTNSSFQTLPIKIYYCTNNKEELALNYTGPGYADGVIRLNVTPEGEETDQIDLTKFTVKLNGANRSNVTLDSYEFVNFKISGVDVVPEESINLRLNELFEVKNGALKVKRALGDYEGYLCLNYVDNTTNDTYVFMIKISISGDELLSKFEDSELKYEFSYDYLRKNSNFDGFLVENKADWPTQLLINDDVSAKVNVFAIEHEYKVDDVVVDTAENIFNTYDISVSEIKDGVVQASDNLTAAKLNYSYSVGLDDIGKIVTFEVCFTDKVFGASHVVYVKLAVGIEELLLFQSVDELTPDLKDGQEATFELASVARLFATKNSKSIDILPDLNKLNEIIYTLNNPVTDGEEPEEGGEETEGEETPSETEKIDIFSRDVLSVYFTEYDSRFNSETWLNNEDLFYFMLPNITFYTTPDYDERYEIKNYTPLPSLHSKIERFYVKYDLLNASGNIIYTYHSYFDITINSVIQNSSGSHNMTPGMSVPLYQDSYSNYVQSVEIVEVRDTLDDSIVPDNGMFSITGSTNKQLTLAPVVGSNYDALYDKIYKVIIDIVDTQDVTLSIVMFITIVRNIETFTFTPQVEPIYVPHESNINLYDQNDDGTFKYDVGTLMFKGKNCLLRAKQKNGDLLFESESEFIAIEGAIVSFRDVLYDTPIVIKGVYTEKDKGVTCSYTFYFNIIIESKYNFISNNLVVLSSGEIGTYRLVNEEDVVDLSKIITVMNGDVEKDSLDVTYSFTNISTTYYDAENNTLTIPKGMAGNFIRVDCMYTNGAQYKSVSYIIKVADLTYSYELKDDTSVYIIQSGQIFNLDTVKGVFRDTDGVLIEGEYEFDIYKHDVVINGVDTQIQYYDFFDVPSEVDGESDIKKLIAYPLYEDVTTYVIVRLIQNRGLANELTFTGRFELNILATYEIETFETAVKVDGGVNTRVEEEAESQDLKVNYFDFGSNFRLNDTYRKVSYTTEEMVVMQNDTESDIRRDFTYIFDEVDITSQVNADGLKYIVDGKEYFSIADNVVTFSEYSSNHKLKIIVTYKSIHTGLSISSEIEITVVQNRFISLMKEDIDTAKLLNGDYPVVTTYSYKFVDYNRVLTPVQESVAAGEPAKYSYSLDGNLLFELSKGALKFTQYAKHYRLVVKNGEEVVADIMCETFIERDNGYILQVSAKDDAANEVLSNYTYTLVSAVPTMTIVDGVETYSMADNVMFTVSESKLSLTSYTNGLMLEVISTYFLEGAGVTYISVQQIDCTSNLAYPVVLTTNNEINKYNNQLKRSFDLRYVIRLVDKEKERIEIKREDFLIYINDVLFEEDSFFVSLGANPGLRQVIRFVDKYTGDSVEYSTFVSG